MPYLRILRGAAVAVGFAFLFNLSQAWTQVREAETVPGIGWAIGVLALIFLMSAYVAERTRGEDDNARKDALWGLGVGGLLGLLVRALIEG